MPLQWHPISSETDSGHTCTARFGHSCTAIAANASSWGTELAVVFGGVTAHPSQDEGQGEHYALDSVAVCELGSSHHETWFEPDAPGGGPRPPARAFHAAAAVGHKVFVFGGHVLEKNAEGRTTRRFFSDLWCLDTESWAWSTVTASGPDHPGARDMCTLSSVGGVLILHGGRCETGRCVNDTWLFDTLRCTWTHAKCGNPVPPPRKMHTATVLAGNRLLVIGGDRDSGIPLDDCWSLKLPPAGELLGGEELRWTPIRVRPAPAARFGHSACVLPEGRSVLALFGGCVDLTTSFLSLTRTYGQTAELWLLDLASFSWSLESPQPVRSSQDGTELPMEGCPRGRMAHSLTALSGGRVLLAGGRNREGICGDAWLLHIPEPTFESPDKSFSRGHSPTPTAEGLTTPSRAGSLSGVPTTPTQAHPTSPSTTTTPHTKTPTEQAQITETASPHSSAQHKSVGGIVHSLASAAAQAPALAAASSALAPSGLFGKLRASLSPWQTQQQSIPQALPQPSLPQPAPQQSQPPLSPQQLLASQHAPAQQPYLTTQQPLLSQQSLPQLAQLQQQQSAFQALHHQGQFHRGQQGGAGLAAPHHAHQQLLPPPGWSPHLLSRSASLPQATSTQPGHAPASFLYPPTTSSPPPPPPPPTTPPELQQLRSKVGLPPIQPLPLTQTTQATAPGAWHSPTQPSREAGRGREEGAELLHQLRGLGVRVLKARQQQQQQQQGAGVAGASRRRKWGEERRPSQDQETHEQQGPHQSHVGEGQQQGSTPAQQGAHQQHVEAPRFDGPSLLSAARVHLSSLPPDAITIGDLRIVCSDYQQLVRLRSQEALRRVEEQGLQEDEGDGSVRRVLDALTGVVSSYTFGSAKSEQGMAQAVRLRDVAGLLSEYKSLIAL